MTKTPDTTSQPNYPDQIISDKSQPGAEHAVNAAPISADLRGISGTHPAAVAQQDPLLLAMHLRQRAKLVTAGSVDALSENAANVLAAQQERIEELERYQAAFNEWHDKTEWGQKTAKPNELGKHRADVLRERIEALPSRECLQQSAEPASVTYMAPDHACKWAWDQVREDVGTEGWTAGESCTFYGFFLWGWNYRGQYETQRPAAPPAPAGVAVPDLDMDRVLSIVDVHAEESREDGVRLLDLGALVAFAKDVLRVAGTPAQEHATQLAGQGPDLREHLRWALQRIRRLDHEASDASCGAKFSGAVASLERADAVFAWSPAAAPIKAQGDALDAAELEEVQRAISDFEECGETHVSYDLLMRAANLGYLDCTRFDTTDDGQAKLDAARAAQG